MLAEGTRDHRRLLHRRVLAPRNPRRRRLLGPGHGPRQRGRTPGSCLDDALRYSAATTLRAQLSRRAPAFVAQELVVTATVILYDANGAEQQRNATSTNVGLVAAPFVRFEVEPDAYYRKVSGPNEPAVFALGLRNLANGPLIVSLSAADLREAPGLNFTVSGDGALPLAAGSGATLPTATVEARIPPEAEGTGRLFSFQIELRARLDDARASAQDVQKFTFSVEASTDLAHAVPAVAPALILAAAALAGAFVLGRR